MNESHTGRNVLLTLVGLAIVGFVAIGIFDLIGWIFSWVILPLIVGALVVGGVYVLAKRSNRSIGSGRSRRIGR